MTVLSLAGTGVALPARIVGNAELAPLLGESPESIAAKCGVLERRWLSDQETMLDLAVRAARKALERSGRTAADLDHVLFATQTPEVLLPGMGCLLQKALEAPKTHSIDVRAQCLGWLQALQIARGLAAAGDSKRALLVCAEAPSLALDRTPSGADTAMIFGDGAAATLVDTGSGQASVETVVCHTDGVSWDQLYCGVSYRNRKHADQDFPAPVMQGRTVMLLATRRIKEVVDEVLAPASLTAGAVDLFLFHQANLHLLAHIRKTLKLSEEQVFTNIARLGNLSGASIPACLHEAMESGRIHRGMRVLAVGYGSGFQWGAALLKF